MTPKEINILVNKAVMTKEVYPSMSFPDIATLVCRSYQGHPDYDKAYAEVIRRMNKPK
jgi:hypothetical protein